MQDQTFMLQLFQQFKMMVSNAHYSIIHLHFQDLKFLVEMMFFFSYKFCVNNVWFVFFSIECDSYFDQDALDFHEQYQSDSGYKPVNFFFRSLRAQSNVLTFTISFNFFLIKYTKTPTVDLKHLAESLGISKLFVKNEQVMIHFFFIFTIQKKLNESIIGKIWFACF